MSMIKKVEHVIGEIVENKATANMHEQAAISAYHKAKTSGFLPGGGLDDWLAVEAEIHARIKAH